MPETRLPVLQIVVASTRPGRVGAAVGRWFARLAREHGGFEVRVTDLAELALPFLDEPNHPRLKQYTKPHTREWSAIVDDADALVFVTPEYNHSFNAVLKNAIDFLHQEWAYKPAGLVSYGGVAAGTRAAQALKPVLTGLRMTVVTEAVAIPFVANLLGPDGEVDPTDPMGSSAKAMLDELAKLAPALRGIRTA